MGNTIKLTLQLGFAMRRPDFHIEVVEDRDELSSWQGQPSHQQKDMPHLKPLARFNRSKFPCDFFTAIRPRQVCSRMRPLPFDSSKENAMGTPKFLEGGIPRLMLSRLKDESGETTSRSDRKGERSVRSDRQDRAMESWTARDNPKGDDENELCNHLRDIIKMTTSMKKVCRKHSLNIRRTAEQQQNKSGLFSSIELPPLVLSRRPNPPVIQAILQLS